MASQIQKPIFHPYDYSYGSNVNILTWIGNQFEDYITHNCLEYHQDTDHARILNIRRSVSGIIHNSSSAEAHSAERVSAEFNSAD